MIRLSDEGRNYGKKNIMWIFEAEQHAMEDTDPHEISTLISMLEKYIFPKSNIDTTPHKDTTAFLPD